MPTLAFHRPVSGRVEMVYGISIRRLHEHWLLDRLAPCALGRFNRLVLHGKIAIATGQAVFVGAAIRHGRRNEISMGRRRRRSPLERGRFPWVVVHLFAMLDAPEKIDDKWDLCDAHDPGGPW